MRITLLKSDEGKARRRFSPGIRLKLIAFLLPLVFLLVVSVAVVVTGITDLALRKDLLQRGAAISRVVALSAGYSLLSGDPLAMDSLASETKNSSSDIEYVAIRDAKNVVVAHSLMEERGKEYKIPDRATPLETFPETYAEEVSREGRGLIEFTTPILFSGKRVGTVSLALSRER